MNLGKASFFLLAVAVLAEARPGGTRGLLNENHWDTNSWTENYGYCNGAVGAIWGDPHVITFDGLTYDCNAAGLFTIMKNFLYNIQGLFVNVNTIGMDFIHGVNDKKKHPRATYATDIVIDNVENPDIPVLQFSFPEHIADELVAEEGCYAYYTLDRYLQGYPAKTVSTISECRQHCLDTEGCYYFQFTYGSGNCRVAPHDALVQEMSGGDFQARTIAGPVDKCGKDYTGRGDVHEFANWYGNGVKYGDTGVCPLLFYVDGELVDISTLSTSDDGVGDYLYGDSNSDVWVQLYLRNKIRIVTKTLEGNRSEITLEVGGQGPGGLFGCHFNIFVCLPRLEKDDFTASTVGLLGSPDMDPENDWMAKDGTLIPVPTGGTTTILGIDALRGEEAFNYCIENWCVSQADSKLIPPEGTTYDDIKCVHEEYIPIAEDNCLVSPAIIHEHCDQHCPALRAQCELECCMGDCDIDVQLSEIAYLKPEVLEKTETEIIYDPIDSEAQAVCDGDAYKLASDEVCPDSGDIVQVLHTKDGRRLWSFDDDWFLDDDNDMFANWTPPRSSAAATTVKPTAAPTPSPVVTAREEPKAEAEISLEEFGSYPPPIIYGVDFVVPHDDSHGREVSFHVGNPTNSDVKMYVRYEKQISQHMSDPACDKQVDVAPGCQESSNKITVSCLEYPGHEPFALVNVFMTSPHFEAGSTEVNKCCHPDDDGFGVVMYSYKIQCKCPDTA